MPNPNADNSPVTNDRSSPLTDAEQQRRYRDRQREGYRTPADYVAACEEGFSRCVMLPYPRSHEELWALDRAHPPTDRHSGWADAFAGFVPDKWHSHRPPPPAEPGPEPEQMDGQTKELIVNSLVQDPEFRQAVFTVLRGAV